MLQSRYACCGIYSKDDYNTMSANLLPSSCCRVANCWNLTESNVKIISEDATSPIHTEGCFSTIRQYIFIQIWTVFGVAAVSAFLQFIALTSMCTLCERYRKFDQGPKFTLSQLNSSGITSNENANSNNNNNSDIQGSSQTIEETVEVTQI